MSIKTSQEKLIRLGYGEYMRPYGADGKLGPKTKKATLEFQKDYNKKTKKRIKEDGIPGPETNKALDHWMKEAGRWGTKNFSIDEFRCKGTGKLPSGGMDNQLLLKLEELRYRLGGKPVIINSGYRTPEHNRKVGGAANSQHLYGRAADIVVKGVSPSKVYQEADKLFNGVGKYPTFTHVDTRPGKKVRF